MAMEDHTHHNQYTIDLRQFISGGPTHHFQSIPHPPPPPDLYRNLPPQTHHYDMMMLLPRSGGAASSGLHDFHSDSAAPPPCMVAAAAPPPSGGGGGGTATSGNTTIAGAAAATPTLSGLETEAGSFGGCDGGTGRWPRQETLTLLEIRSRLDSKFKEANQKGPLWDEVSRIMCEEHGYQRSGKKCREKFENLYKYYKKTKEGKAGRQDGKHYRFFRQLEALYGETSNSASIPETHFITSIPFHNACSTQTNNQETNLRLQNKLCDSLSLSNSSEFDTCSSDEDNNLSTATLMENDSIDKRMKRRDGRSWKGKIKEFIDSQMKKLMARQEAWLDKLTKTLEQKEQERTAREEEWRQNETARIDREHKFWAKERAWIEARDAALMDTLRKLTGNEIQNQTQESDDWSDEEIAKLMLLKSSCSESRFEEEEGEEEDEEEEKEALWEEIAAKMGGMGYQRSARMCKEKWESSKMSNFPRKVAKKRKENSNSRNCSYYPRSDQAMYNASNYEISEQENQETANSSAVVVNDSCFRFLMSDGTENLWANYGLKLSKHQQE